jgi:hypothetical protein
MEVGVAYVAVGAMSAIGGALGLAVVADAPKEVEQSPSLGDQKTHAVETSRSVEPEPTPPSGMVSAF